jgi:peptidoglycan-associated lipoprotein
MNARVIGLGLSLSFVLLFAGCAGKNVSSSSGDSASQAGQAKTEQIQPDAIKTVPLERSFDRPAGSGPSNPAIPLSAVSADSALSDVFFDYDQSHIRVDAMPLLDANAGWLRANGSKHIVIEGHCDERGTAAYNLVLGEKRARTVKKYLVDLGVQATQLQIASFGEARPFCKQQNEICYQQNRRAHFAAK